MNEQKHCEAVAKARLDAHATKTHPDGVYHFVAWADIADLIERERAAARAQGRAEAREEAAARVETFAPAAAIAIRALGRTGGSEP